MLIIECCRTKPGLIKSAQSYKLMLNKEGLLILHLGRAMGTKINDNTNPIANRLAQVMIGKMEQKLAKKLSEIEGTISDQDDLMDLVDNKQSFFLKRENIQEVKFAKNLQGDPKLALKSSELKITLHFAREDGQKAEQISAFFN